MNTDQILLAVVIMITAAVVARGVASRLKLGTTVALLVAGMALGPHSPRPLMTGHVDELQAVGEIGLILLLFVLGLDTQPKHLVSMRRLVFGLGTAQLLLTAAAIVGLLYIFTLAHWQSTIIVGLGLAMSSSALAISTLDDRGENTSPHGRAVTAVAIYQSLMVVPLLAAIPILAAAPAHGAPMPTLAKGLEVLAAIAAVFVFARYGVPKALAWAARSFGFEVFTLIIVAAVFAAAWLMDTVGASSALGAFLVGLLLSETVFAEQIKSSVSLTKGLLLGIFFIAIGMSIDLNAAMALGSELLLALPALLLVKALLALALALAFGLARGPAILVGVLLAPFDEIAFVVFASAHGSGLLTEQAYTVGLTMISFSFVVSPLLLHLGYRLAARFEARPRAELPLQQLSETMQDHVIVVGYAGVGRTICVMLERANIPYIAFELDLDRLAEAKAWGHNVHYGDVTDPTMMGALAISRARAVILTMTDYPSVKRMIGNLRRFYPKVKDMTAVPYLHQRDELRQLGVVDAVALLPEGALSFGGSVLGELGVPVDDVELIVGSLRADDYAILRGIGAALAVPESEATSGPAAPVTTSPES